MFSSIPESNSYDRLTSGARQGIFYLWRPGQTRLCCGVGAAGFRKTLDSYRKRKKIGEVLLPKRGDLPRRAQRKFEIKQEDKLLFSALLCALVK
jgi:hypothetical protein